MRVSLLLTGLIVLGLGVGTGVYVTAQGARATGELALDVAIARHRDTVLNTIGLVIHVGLGPAIAPLILLVVCVALWWRNRFASLVAAVVTASGWLSVSVAKLVFHRPRPPAATVHALVVERAPDSFPSGHTAFAAALVAALYVVAHGHPRRRRWILGGGIPVVVLVAASRLEVGAHYLGDVVAAPLFVLGTVLVLVTAGAPAAPRVRRALTKHGASAGRHRRHRGHPST